MVLDALDIYGITAIMFVHDFSHGWINSSKGALGQTHWEEFHVLMVGVAKDLQIRSIQRIRKLIWTSFRRALP